MYNNQKLILGIDTATNILDIAILTYTGEIIASFTSTEEKTHSERALPAIEKCLKDANLTTADIETFACCMGPGSYTGTRIGVAIAKALALAHGKTALGISSFILMQPPNRSDSHDSYSPSNSDKRTKFSKIVLRKQNYNRCSLLTVNYSLKKVTACIIDARNSAVFTDYPKPRRVNLADLKEELNAKFGENNYTFIHPHPNKWQGIKFEDLEEINISYLGGSI